MYSKKICVSKKIVVFSFIVLGLIVSSLYLTQKIGSSKLSYNSKAAPPKSPQKIYGGDAVTDPTKWPFMAVLIIKRDEVTQREFCSGTIIDPNWILTSAHCAADIETGEPFDYRSIRVFVGVKHHDDTYTGNTGNFQDNLYEVVKDGVKIFPGFKFYNHDIALLKLNRPIPNTSLTNSIRLSNSPKLDNEEIDGVYQYGLILGYGVDENGQSGQLKQAVVPIISNDRYNKQSWNEYKINSTKISAGYPLGRVGICSTDSGGPLLVRRNGQWIQIGIGVGSYGMCGEARKPSLFTRISYYHDWITGTIFGFPNTICSYINGKKKCRIDTSDINGTFSPTFIGTDLTVDELDEFECRINNGMRPKWLPEKYQCGYELKDDDKLE